MEGRMIQFDLDDVIRIRGIHLELSIEVAEAVLHQVVKSRREIRRSVLGHTNLDRAGRENHIRRDHAIELRRLLGKSESLSRKKLMRELNREKYGGEDQREAHPVHVGPSCLR